jgi:hypothetical protein
MKPAIVFPMNDRSGVTFDHLRSFAGDLAGLFERAYVCITPAVRLEQAEAVAWLEAEPLFHAFTLPDELPVGALFREFYKLAADDAPASQVLHLCFADRLAFTLLSEHRPAFFADVRALDPDRTPLIFQRSRAAWDTHPENYRQIENMVTRTGEFLFGNRLDYAWCHLALKAADLQKCLSLVTRNDLAMVAEIILPLREKCRSQEVDWLAWEDPFILDVDQAELKAARENSAAETRKRLSYAIPMLQLLEAASRNGHQ